MTPQAVSTAPAIRRDSEPPPYSASPTVPPTSPVILAPSQRVSHLATEVILPGCTDEEDQQIDLLLAKMVELGVLNAIPVGTELMKIGTSIKDVHPLTFLLQTVKTQNRIKNLKSIFGAQLKRYNFMNYRNGGPSLSQKLTLKAKEKDFNALLTIFAQKLGINEPFAKQCALSHEWGKISPQYCKYASLGTY